MEKKFTKGQWTLGDENNSSCDVNCGETIISLSRYPLHGDGFVIERDEMYANACLVIAAPALLEALEAALTELEQFIPVTDVKVIDKVKAAISKALNIPK